ncbi:hypothetical protein NIES2104_63920 [Leptolyngbya sp. NIES-2104]|nr:hypothetical protein NIES2104_63920 [Leptolyngbya sp. NIES-2104]
MSTRKAKVDLPINSMGSTSAVTTPAIETVLLPFRSATTVQVKLQLR